MQLRQIPVERLVSKMSVCTNYLLARWEFLLANIKIRAFLRGGGQKVVSDLQSVALEIGFQAQKIITIIIILILILIIIINK